MFDRVLKKVLYIINISFKVFFPWKVSVIHLCLEKWGLLKSAKFEEGWPEEGFLEEFFDFERIGLKGPTSCHLRFQTLKDIILFGIFWIIANKLSLTSVTPLVSTRTRVSLLPMLKIYSLGIWAISSLVLKILFQESIQKVKVSKWFLSSRSKI